jgi:DNA transformation protein
MVRNSEFAGFVVDALAEFGEVSIRNMFGGGGVYHDGLMFALIAGDVLYLKADTSTHADFAAEGKGPFIYPGKKGPVRMSYWEVPERLFEDTAELALWADKAYGVALKARKK